VSASGPYFADFGRRAKAATSIPIMLTGGFETREQAVAAIQDGAADAIGLARSMVLDPSLPNAWLSDRGGDPDFPQFDAPPKGGVTAWYSMRLTALSEYAEDGFNQSPAAALDTYEARDAERCSRWQERFA
jgi:hypothetical protein